MPKNREEIRLNPPKKNCDFVKMKIEKIENDQGGNNSVRLSLDYV